MRRAEREGAQTERERRAEVAAIIRVNVSELYARLWRPRPPKRFGARRLC